MIIYHATKAGFLDDVFKRDIEAVILGSYAEATGRRVAPAQLRAWKESLFAMAQVLNDESIPDDCGLAVEYTIPQTAKRIDLLLSGLDESGQANILIVELKQWEYAEPTGSDGIVKTYMGGAEVETSHPSYQAWSYAELLRNFNEAVYTQDLPLQPCAYLHNFKERSTLEGPAYAEYVDNAPFFISGQGERERLRNYIARHVHRGDRGNLIVEIDNGRIRPSKRLVDALLGMLAGKREFVLIDEQKVVFETILARAATAETGPKQVIIVDGGPGTGKSVVAINLLAALTARRRLTKYVTKNSAPRAVFETTISGSNRKSQIAALFSGSGSFIGTPVDTFDALVVDEAHRLNAKGGLYGNLGENQIKEIIHAARCSIFFIDEDQRVTWLDIGRKTEIEDWAGNAGAMVTHLRLESQFRCAGSDGYLAWLDDVLGIRPTANPLLDPAEYDFQVFHSPNEVRSLIEAQNKPANRARMVAGYCWDWKSKKNPNVHDVVIPEFGFAMQWNLADGAPLWMIAKDSVKQIGCIHTCQGLEADYIGVIVGPDLVARDGILETRPEKRSRHDKSLKGYKKAFQTDPDSARAKADAIIRNTYRTLMTRGMKGCYIYCTDRNTADYFRSRIVRARVPSERAEVAEDRAKYDPDPL
ncbi:MAG: DUF2075 domain-containing protein [Bryobacteraceae bacterium]|nr:DUF2075 domain-containing protein [Bryobacteraceae bacterium]